MNCSSSYRIQTDLATRFIYVLINVFTALLAIVGNFFLLFVVFKSYRLRTTSNYFLCSLAVADFLVGLIASPLNILRIEPSIPASYLPAIGKIFDFCVLQTLMATTFNLVLVSIDRYIAIKWSLQYLTILTTKFVSVAIGITWTSSSLLAFPGLFIYGEGLMIHWLVTVLVTLIFPLGIICFCYVEILKITKAQQKTHAVVLQSGEQICNESEARNNIKNRKASLTFAIITVVFLVSFAPNLICNVFYAFTFQPCSKIPEYFYWTNTIMFISSSLNPLLYGARSRDFRLAFKRITSNFRVGSHG
ncbi:tyramine receptor Ser-2-like [Actinia tenebrosa]|uniref:Tyramine receptor Ser-2-like n=1 Tax=Actinia tenebrosa TaxID=6105 RepID=A0A6P8IPX2_ACTTE|nr:tyramine receptor Ser-2-like [Actinia tenebrosa]